jgi:hypothetical protein
MRWDPFACEARAKACRNEAGEHKPPDIALSKQPSALCNKVKCARPAGKSRRGTAGDRVAAWRNMATSRSWCKRSTGLLPGDVPWQCAPAVA